MSDLQLSLLVIGATVIGAVLVYNWMQERSFRRRLEQAFGDAPEDVLLRRGEGDGGGAGRIEPQLPAAGPPGATAPVAAPEPAGAAAPARASTPSRRSFDPALDYVAAIEADVPIPEAAVEELLTRIAGCGRPTRVLGCEAASGEWEELARGGEYLALQVGLQLVNRAGAAGQAELAAFCDAVRACAGKAGGTASCPDPQEALKRSRDLDAFCSGVDVAIGVNVVAAQGAHFTGARIRELAEGAGFKLEPDGVFHCYSERRQTLFTLDNHEPAPFLPERLKGLTTRGVTLMLDVPRVENGLAVLDRMLEIGRALATALSGSLVDDNRAPLTDAGIARIRGQLSSIHDAMAARGMAAGDARALRLFS